MKDIQVCLEDWSDGEGETIQKGQRFRWDYSDKTFLFENFLTNSYTMVAGLFQYILPLILTAVFYYRIYKFLKVMLDIGILSILNCSFL